MSKHLYKHNSKIKFIFVVFLVLFICLLLSPALNFSKLINPKEKVKYMKVIVDSVVVKYEFAKDLHLSTKESLEAAVTTKDILPASPQGTTTTVPVLIYHSIVQTPGGENVPLDKFKDQMFALKKAGYTTISIDDFYGFLKKDKELPAKSILITFDDGAKASYYPVDPILRALNYKATSFIITKFSLDETNNFYLSKSELKYMLQSKRWDLQAHTHAGHVPITIDQSGKQGLYYSNRMWLTDKKRLETIDEYRNRIGKDMLTAKTKMEQTFGINVMTFAFPFGDFGGTRKGMPESEQIVHRLASSIYQIGFQQEWNDSGFYFSQNYPDKDAFFAKRIIVAPDWSGKDLVKLLEQGQAKELPYSDNFANDNGWLSTWGQTTAKDSLLVLSSSEGSEGTSNYLDGTYLWKNYTFNAETNLKRGKSLSLFAGFKDVDNYVTCTFSNGTITIYQKVNGESQELETVENSFAFPEENFVKLGINVNENVIQCLVADKIILTTHGKKGSSTGGIGFQTWGGDKKDSLAEIQSLSVKNN